MKKILAIDTSTSMASIALKINGEIETIEQADQKTHAQTIVSLIDSLMKKAGISFKMLDAIVFGQGPGSFTGLRVACSVAKGLAFAHDTAVIPISSLSAIACQAALKYPSYPILAMIDARMNELYWAFYDSNAFTAEEKVSAMDSIKIPGIADVLIAGVGIKSYYEQISKDLKPRVFECLEIYPSASSMISLAESGAFDLKTAAEVKPVYIRNKVTQGGKRG